MVKKKMGDDAQSECESQRRLRVQVKKKWKKEKGKKYKGDHMKKVSRAKWW